MNNKNPRAGDRALIISPKSVLRGRIVDVLSDPFSGDAMNVETGEVVRGPLSKYRAPTDRRHPTLGEWAMPTRYLVRIPPWEWAFDPFTEQVLEEIA